MLFLAAFESRTPGKSTITAPLLSTLNGPLTFTYNVGCKYIVLVGGMLAYLLHNGPILSSLTVSERIHITVNISSEFFTSFLSNLQCNARVSTR